MGQMFVRRACFGPNMSQLTKALMFRCREVSEDAAAETAPIADSLPPSPPPIAEWNVMIRCL